MIWVCTMLIRRVKPAIHVSFSNLLARVKAGVLSLRKNRLQSNGVQNGKKTMKILKPTISWVTLGNIQDLGVPISTDRNDYHPLTSTTISIMLFLVKKHG